MWYARRLGNVQTPQQSSYGVIRGRSSAVVPLPPRLRWHVGVSPLATPSALLVSDFRKLFNFSFSLIIILL